MSYHRGTRGRSTYDDDYSVRYSEHDDRTGHLKRGRGRNARGSYKGGKFYSDNSTKSYHGNRGRYVNRSGRGRGRGFSQRRNGDSSPYRKDEDGDVSMDGEQTSHRFNPYARPKRGGRGNFSQPKRYGQPKDSWYQITIIDGENLDEDWLHQELQTVNMIQYTPVQYHQDNTNTSFFLKDRSAAEKLRECSKQLTAPSGEKIVILMRPAYDPPLTEDQISKLKEVLSKRYDTATQHLDASGLFHDQDLRKANIVIKLQKPAHAAIVNKIISQHISSLVSIDLSNNALSQLDGFHSLVLCTNCVQKVSLAKNRLNIVKELDKIRSWDLVELTLDGNPLCSKYDSESAYISDIREYFPNVMVLDGQTLPPPVKFDVEKQDLPKPIRDHYPPSGLDVIENFVKAYFGYYDKSRSSLSDAYHENAVFSLNVPTQRRGPSLGKYLEFNRNLNNSKHKKVAKGQAMNVATTRAIILSRFSKLPATTHELRTFCIDVPLATSSIVNFIVRGLFKEENGTCRAFSRSFLCRVSGTSLQIINEQYFIRNPTPLELKEMKAPALSSPPSAPQPSANNAAPAGHTQMVAAFAAESGMNLRYSEQCLAENGWDYNKAGQVFLELKAKGSIPSEAFAK